jgi:hypothetical protein
MFSWKVQLDFFKNVLDILKNIYLANDTVQSDGEANGLSMSLSSIPGGYLSKPRGNVLVLFILILKHIMHLLSSKVS